MAESRLGFFRILPAQGARGNLEGHADAQGAHPWPQRPGVHPRLPNAVGRHCRLQARGTRGRCRQRSPPHAGQTAHVAPVAVKDTSNAESSLLAQSIALLPGDEHAVDEHLRDERDGEPDRNRPTTLRTLALGKTLCPCKHDMAVAGAAFACTDQGHVDHARSPCLKLVGTGSAGHRLCRQDEAGAFQNQTHVATESPGRGQRRTETQFRKPALAVQRHRRSRSR